MFNAMASNHSLLDSYYDIDSASEMLQEQDADIESSQNLQIVSLKGTVLFTQYLPLI